VLKQVSGLWLCCFVDFSLVRCVTVLDVTQETSSVQKKKKKLLRHAEPKGNKETKKQNQ
jgi:hypothetical protein